MVSLPLPPMVRYFVVSWAPGSGPTNGAAETEDEPMTTPAFPDAEKSAPSAALWKCPLLPAPVDTPSNVSVFRPSEFTLTPWASTVGPAGAATITVCTAGSTSPTIDGASLVPVTVTTTSCDVTPPSRSSTSHRVGQRQDLALRQIVERGRGRGERQIDRAGRGAGSSWSPRPASPARSARPRRAQGPWWCRSPPHG